MNEESPSLEWKVLELFAAHRGRIHAEKNEITELVMKNLSKRLQDYFCIEDEPILYDEKNGEYYTLFKLFFCEKPKGKNELGNPPENTVK